MLFLYLFSLLQAATPEFIVTWKGGGLTEEEVNRTVQPSSSLADQYAVWYTTMDRMINERLLAAEATRLGLPDVEALLQREIRDKAKPGNTEWQRYAAYLSTLRRSYGVQIILPPPEPERLTVSIDDDPSVGPANAAVTIVEFGDYQCPYCAKVEETLLEIMKDYAGKVRFVYRDFPLSFHAQARPAAIAANCAIPQGKFWVVREGIFQLHSSITPSDLTNVARRAGLNLRDWNACLNSPTVAAEIDHDIADATASGVTGTPIFFINGLAVSGAQPYEKFAQVIDQELKRLEQR